MSKSWGSSVVVGHAVLYGYELMARKGRLIWSGARRYRATSQWTGTPPNKITK